MHERQTNALALRSWSGQHSVSALLQHITRSDARLRRGLSVRKFHDTLNPLKLITINFLEAIA